MRTYELSGMASARVWIDECPEHPDRRKSGHAIEVSIPRGGMCEYGLLGAMLLPGQPATCTVSVSPQGELWSDSLAKDLDDVHFGLPLEFVTAVQRAGEEALSGSGLAVGLEFDCAAYGAIGSSPNLFARLAVALVRLAANPAALRNDAHLQAILEDVRKD